MWAVGLPSYDRVHELVYEVVVELRSDAFLSQADVQRIFDQSLKIRTILLSKTAETHLHQKKKKKKFLTELLLVNFFSSPAKLLCLSRVTSQL